MAYVKPSPFIKHVFNRIALRFGVGGAKGLVVRGRSTGQPQRIPVSPLDHDGQQYLVSVRGESDWVRNIRAAGGGELAGEPFRVVEIPAEEREPIIAAYRELAGKGVDPYWKKLPDPEDHPVFRVELGAT